MEDARSTSKGIAEVSKQTKTEARTMTFRDSQAAFEDAIREGRLSTDKTEANWAANYMYMGTNEYGDDLFKNIETRRYDV